MIYRPGDIVLVPFPFTDQNTTKQRPGVIVASAAYLHARHDLVLMPITSQLSLNRQLGDVTISDWKSAGLLKQSVVKPVIATLEQSLVIKKLGHLSDRDRQLLKRALTELLM